MRTKARWDARKLSRAIASVGLLLGATAACLEDVTGVRELSMTLTAGATSVVAGDSVQFDYSAEGRGLVIVWFEYGDGGADTVRFSGGYEVVEYGPEPEDEPKTDTLFYPGPLEVAGRLGHVFEAPGTFSVVGHALAATGVATDTVRVAVN